MARDGFGRRGRGEVERALQYAGEASGLKYAVVVREVEGGVTGGVRGYAEGVHAAMADPPRSVLVVVDPQARVVEIVTGTRSARRIPDDACARVADSIGRTAAHGDLVRALVGGLQQLGQVAGPPRATARLLEQLPD